MTKNKRLRTQFQLKVTVFCCYAAVTRPLLTLSRRLILRHIQPPHPVITLRNFINAQRDYTLKFAIDSNDIKCNNEQMRGGWV